MKNNKLFAALAMGLAVVACTPKGEAAQNEEAEGQQTEAVAENVDETPAEKTAKDYVPSKQELKDVSYLVGINFGSFIKNYNFGDLDWAQIKKGMEDFINAKGNMRSEEFGEQFRVNPNDMNELFNNFLENRHYYVLYTNKEKEEKFLAANAKKGGVIETPSGLQYKIIADGNKDLVPTIQDTVWVNYKGTLLDGTVFDETPADAEPVQMMLSYVVAGWQEGLQLIGEGGEIELYIPAALGYGENGNQGIEPNSTLIFNVKLAKVGKVAAQEAE